jgi:hypothetical protein
MTDAIQAHSTNDQLGDATDRQSAPTIQGRHGRRWLIAAGAGGLAIAAATVAIAVDATDRTQIERVEIPVDPAVVQAARERAQIAAWATEHHMTGLSPESLRPAP